MNNLRRCVVLKISLQRIGRQSGESEDKDRGYSSGDDSVILTPVCFVVVHFQVMKGKKKDAIFRCCL